MTSRRIIIDTDPGLDDAVAILLAFASPELEVLGLTAVAGNVPLALTEANARRLCELANRRDAKVFAGCTRPMVRPLVTAELVHGQTGLDGADLPPPTMALQEQHAVDWLIDTVMAAPSGDITLCALGPLTNIAMAFVKEPRIVPRLREVVVMGGAEASGGNVTAAAEFNIYCDPQAAYVVLTAGAPTTLIPLDVTRQVLTTPERLARISAIGSPVSRAVTGIIEFFNGRAAAEGEGHLGPLHDPCVIAHLLRPALFEGMQAHVQIDIHSELTMGMTLIDRRLHDGHRPNCQVLHAADADGFFALLTERLARL